MAAKILNKSLCNHHSSFQELSVSALKASGARVTEPRLSVIRCLDSAAAPLSAREIFSKLSNDKKAQSIDQVSVYRTLESLEALGLVHQVFPSGGYFSCYHQHCGSTLHVLTRCSSCEAVEELDVPQETIAPMIWYLQQKRKFVADSHLFQINGLCVDCKKSK